MASPARRGGETGSATGPAAREPARGSTSLLAAPLAARGVISAGTVHHIAFRAALRRGAARLAGDPSPQRGLHVTPVQERQYFRSIYFREPAGCCSRSRTDAPGSARRADREPGHGSKAAALARILPGTDRGGSAARSSSLRPRRSKHRRRWGAGGTGGRCSLERPPALWDPRDPHRGRAWPPPAAPWPGPRRRSSSSNGRGSDGGRASSRSPTSWTGRTSPTWRRRRTGTPGIPTASSLPWSRTSRGSRRLSPSSAISWSGWGAAGIPPERTVCSWASPRGLSRTEFAARTDREGRRLGGIVGFSGVLIGPARNAPGLSGLARRHPGLSRRQRSGSHISRASGWTSRPGC